MAPRRVAAALAASDDTLEDSIRGALANGADAQQQDDGADGADDQQQDDGADDGADDQQQDDGADDGADDQQQGDPQEQPRRVLQTRRQPREPAASQLSPEAEARLAAAERRADEAQARADAMMQAFGQPRETPEQEAARLATMTPEQIIDYKVNKALGQVNQTVQRSTFAAQNAADKASFDATVMSSPQLKRMAVEVERKHAEMVRESMRTGASIPFRKQLLTFMLGEKALELAERAAPQQRERQQRVQRQQVRPNNSRSEVASSRRQSQTLEQRLDGVQL